MSLSLGSKPFIRRNRIGFMLFDEIMQKGFAASNIAPYGEVLVIPPKDFEYGWETALRAEGHGVYQASVEGRIVFLVSTKTKTLQRGVPLTDALCWTKEEEKRLLQRWPELKGGTVDEKCAALTSEFPSRTTKALELKYRKLTKKTACSKCGLPTDLCSCQEEEKEKQRIATREAGQEKKTEKTEPAGEVSPQEGKDVTEENKPQKIMGFEQVRVDWLDTVSYPGKVEIEDAKKMRPILAHSLGFLIHESKDSITLTMTLFPRIQELTDVAEKGGEVLKDDTASELLIIPKVCVVKIQRLIEKP